MSHTSHCTLHTPHFISSEPFSPYPSSSLLISSLLICHLSFHESLPSTTTTELACAVRQPGRACVLCAKLLQCCCPRTRPARDPGTMQTLSSHFTLHSSHPTRLCFGEEAGARNLVFFRVKWLQATMKGTSCVRRVRLRSFRTRLVPSMCFATSACSCGV